MDAWWSSDEAGPGTHALVIGVSHYDNLPPGAAADADWVVGMRQLESAAITAAEFARWLHDVHHIPGAPLRSIWLLLSPSDAELDGLTEREREAPRAGMANVESAVDAWVRACRSETGNVAVLYAAGHGIATTSVEPGILLLEDYGAGGMERLLDHALSITTLRAGLAASPGGAPARQFGFFDACRTEHEASLAYNLGAAFPRWTVAKTPTAISHPMYLGAADGAPSYGRTGGGRTLFWEALKPCLALDAVSTLGGDDSVWGIRDDWLLAPVIARLTAIAHEAGVTQSATVVGTPAGSVIHVCKKPPPLACTFAVVPSDAGPWASGTLRHDDLTRPRFEDVSLAEPYDDTVPAGTYELAVTIDPDHPPYIDRRIWRMIRPGGDPRIDVSVVTGREAPGS